MFTKNRIQIIIGTAFPLDNPNALLETLKKNGINRIDTAYRYGTEEALGNCDAQKDFIIDTKANGFFPHVLSRESILQAMNESLQRLKTKQVHTYYLHSPDPAGTSLVETLGTVNELYMAGKFKQFGLSNFTADQVQEVYNVAKENNYILPTVYEGNMNAFARHSEQELLPILRKLGISFRAYSPIAGGFLVKSAQDIKENTAKGRWDTNSFFGKMYHTLYNKPLMVEALDEWEQISEDSGIPRGELAYRWIAYNSALQEGDALIIGFSKLEHIDQTCQWLNNGPVPNEYAQRIDKIWSKISDEAPVDNYVSFSLVTH